MLIEGSVSGTGIYTPEQAFKLDKKEDDGLPNTGKVKASGSGCIKSGKYNLANDGLSGDKKVCRLTIQKRSKDIGAAFATANERSKSCGTIGDKRRSGEEIPDGYEGVIIEVCQSDGNWKEFRDLKIITCEGGGVVGDTQNVSCPDGYSGSVEQRCNKQGVWVYNSDNCAINTESCREGKSRSLACLYQQSGLVLQSCRNGNWYTKKDNCALVTCGSTSVGDTIEVPNACTNWYSGTVTYMCTADGTTVPIKNSCNTITGVINCTNENTVQTIEECPPGEEGSFTQRCDEVDGLLKWVTIENNCKPVACEGARIGSSRMVSKSCPPGSIGYMQEICQDDGSWKEDDSNCAQIKCAGGPDTVAGNMEWSNKAAGKVASEPCPSLGPHGSYTASGDQPTRKCSIGGVWGDVPDDQHCLAIQACPALNTGGASNGFATWNQTVATSHQGVVVTGSCENGYIADPSGTAPQRTCNPDGSWSEITGGLCVYHCPAGNDDTYQVSWPEIIGSIQTVTGTCLSGYDVQGSAPTAKCVGPNTRGNFSGNACGAVCEAGDDSTKNVAWPRIVGNTLTQATECFDGYAVSLNSDPSSLPKAICSSPGVREYDSYHNSKCKEMCSAKTKNLQKGSCDLPAAAQGTIKYKKCYANSGLASGGNFDWSDNNSWKYKWECNSNAKWEIKKCPKWKPHSDTFEIKIDRNDNDVCARTIEYNRNEHTASCSSSSYYNPSCKWTESNGYSPGSTWHDSDGKCKPRWCSSAEKHEKMEMRCDPDKGWTYKFRRKDHNHCSKQN